jgi:hypothetical protein
VTPVSESLRPATHRRRASRASKGLLCPVLVAALFVALASPAAAEEPAPEPATPTLPDPDPAPAPVPKPAPKKPAARSATTPRYVAPEVDSPAPQTRSVPSAQVPAEPNAPAKPVVPKPAETIRHLPIRDSSIVRVDETTLVLAASGVVPAAQGDGGISATEVVAVLWLGLAGALLLIAYFAPLAVVAPHLNDRRGQFALIGTNMVVAAAVGYFVVVVAS